MGHNLAVHREFYRLPEDAYQLARVGKLLLSLDAGTFKQYKGNTLDQID